MMDAGVMQRSGATAFMAAGMRPAPARLPRRMSPVSETGRDCRPHARELDGLSGSRSARRFRAWRGGSGRRYVFSVFPMGAGLVNLDDVPLDQEAVVIAAVRASDGSLHPLWIDLAGGRGHDWRSAACFRILAGRVDCELHVHLLAEDREARQAVVDDLLSA